MWFDKTLPNNARCKHGNLSGLADRQWLEKEYLPTLSGDVLFVGVQAYTDFYHLLAPQAHFTTVDVNPMVAQFGSPHRHFVGTLDDLFDDDLEPYDNIILYGLFGLDESYIKEPFEIQTLLVRCVLHLRNDGRVLFANSTDTMDADQFLSMPAKAGLSIVEDRRLRPNKKHSEMVILTCQAKKLLI